MDCSIFSELVDGYSLTIDFRSKSGTSPDFDNLVILKVNLIFDKF